MVRSCRVLPQPQLDREEEQEEHVDAMDLEGEHAEVKPEPVLKVRLATNGWGGSTRLGSSAF